MRDIVHFSHGNGFPSPCYRQLLQHLQLTFACCYIDRIGHAAEYPVTENWRYLVDEVTASIRAQASQPVIAVGHSLGGVLSLVAAMEQPSLFKAVILLDSPLLSRFKSDMVRLSKALGIIDQVTPASHTSRRQQHWQSRDHAVTYLRSRPLFRRFTDACLADYVDYGLQKDEDGYSLRFDREIECQIYRTIPHKLHEYEGKLTVPTALIYGNQSTIMGLLDRQYMRKFYGIMNIETKGTHMFPMEYPKNVAKLIVSAVNTLLKERPD